MNNKDRAFSNIEDNIASEKKIIESPDPVSRNREFLSHSEQERSKVVYDYLFNGSAHRYIDKYILGLDPKQTRGYHAMGILHHLGLKNAHKGIFKGISVNEAIELIKQECTKNPAKYHLFSPIVLLLNEVSMDKKQEKGLIDSFQDNEGREYPEGSVAFVLHKQYERNSKLIQEAKKRFVKIHGHLYCEACNFDFQKKYGERGSNFIEGHHKKLVSEMKEGEKTRIEDIAMLCSNCHAMIHKKPLVSVENLKELIRQNTD